MAKHQRKVEMAVKHRVEGMPIPSPNFFYRKPGSQNRKKAWDKAPIPK